MVVECIFVVLEKIEKYSVVGAIEFVVAVGRMESNSAKILHCDDRRCCQELTRSFCKNLSTPKTGDDGGKPGKQREFDRHRAQRKCVRSCTSFISSN